MPDFQLDRENRDGCLILRPRGYLDAGGGEQIKQACADALARGVRKVVLNLIGSPVINSTGVAQLLEMAEMLVDDHAGSLAVCGLSELTTSVLKMVGLLTPEIHFKTEGEALAALAAQ